MVASLAMVLIALVFNKGILIAYHKNKLMVATDNYMLMTHQGPMPTLLQETKIRVFGMSPTSTSDAMPRHEAALLAMGYLQKQAFELTNRFMGVGTNWPYFHQCATNTFPGALWTYHSPMSNKLVVTDVAEHLPKWKKLITEFDR
jgi:hypothetical protein